jgi:hypothetical protein
MALSTQAQTELTQLLEIAQRNEISLENMVPTILMGIDERLNKPQEGGNKTLEALAGMAITMDSIAQGVEQNRYQLDQQNKLIAKQNASSLETLEKTKAILKLLQTKSST